MHLVALMLIEIREISLLGNQTWQSVARNNYIETFRNIIKEHNKKELLFVPEQFLMVSPCTNWNRKKQGCFIYTYTSTHTMTN